MSCKIVGFLRQADQCKVNRLHLAWSGADLLFKSLLENSRTYSLIPFSAGNRGPRPQKDGSWFVQVSTSPGP
jgi:hypothetical protein